MGSKFPIPHQLIKSQRANNEYQKIAQHLKKNNALKMLQHPKVFNFQLSGKRKIDVVNSQKMKRIINGREDDGFVRVKCI